MGKGKGRKSKLKATEKIARMNMGNTSKSCEHGKIPISSSSEHDHGTLENLSKELESLQILNENLCGDNLDSLSLRDLKSLEIQILEGYFSLKETLSEKAMEQEEVERVMINEGVDVKSKRNEGLTLEMSFSKERRQARKKAIELRSSSQYRTERRTIEDMKSDISRIQLWNRRMCGEELHSLDYFQMMILRMELNIAMNNVGEEIDRRTEQ